MFALARMLNFAAAIMLLAATPTLAQPSARTPQNHSAIVKSGKAVQRVTYRSPSYVVPESRSLFDNF